MTLFISRRALNTQKDRFSNGVSSLTRYVSITGKVPKGKWSADVIDRDAFIAKAKTEAKSDDVLIYVHGFNTKQQDMLNRHKVLEAGLRKFGFKGVVISFDWPSEGKGSIAAYRRDLKKKASKMGRHLVEDIILAFLASSWRPRVHLLGHSMGAHIIQDGFSKFGDSNGPGTGPWRVEQILLASGDAHKRDFEKGTAGSLVLKHHSVQLTNYYNTEDSILSLATGYHLKPRVGQNGMPDLTEKSHIDVYATARYLKIKPIFATNGEGAAFSHGWWFEDDRFLKDAALTLLGQAAASLPTRSVTNLGTPALKP